MLGKVCFPALESSPPEVLDLLRQNLGAVAMEPGMAFAQLPGVRAARDALRKHVDAEGLAMPMLE